MRRALSLIVLLTACQGGGPTGGPADVGTSMPTDVQLRRITAQQPLSRIAEGRVVVVDFWATWCEPCRETIPKVVRLADAYAQTDLVVVGVHVGQGDDVAADYAAEAGIDYPVFADPEFTLADQVGVAKVPAILLIDRRGAVAYRAEEIDAAFLAEVRQLVSSSAVSP